MPGSAATPYVSFPFVDSGGFLTPSALQALQPLFSLTQGLGTQLTAGGLAADRPQTPAPQVDFTAVNWTPTLKGSTTAGVPTYTTQVGLQVDIGPARLISFAVAVSALGGIAGNVQIGGLGIQSNAATGLLQAAMLSQWSGATLNSSYTQLGLTLAPATSVFSLMQSGSGQNALALPASGLAAASFFAGAALYLR